MIALFDLTINSSGEGGPLVEGLSLKMEAGSWHEIVGPAGVGKSAIFNVLSLRTKAAKGRLVLAGRNVDRLKRGGIEEIRKELGSCPQRPELLWHRSAVENVVLPLVVRGDSRRALREAEESLGFLGVMPERDIAVGQLSGQHQALVALAMATVGAPRVVLVDGVHEVLEPAVRGVALSWLERVQKSGSTIVVFGRRAMNRRASSVLWRLRDGDVERTGEVERC